ncbi:sodium/hydrogen exchanger [Desulfocurvibacter africanus]|uniref:Sodium/calcium exchanger membrane region n=1 Tax=Desulfocurvibacter africanus subsp. africanus str. Walvis Bay TaxID=690850 RepID=F3Z3L1_DESAF|nr:sodium/hydrogen exchanger [Desulfocurvibacter africanus]EGJ50383.1 sodium/calcium exchanger membrane region [Desulfocurvibacter africanus subsp. africanus str. Walvis Bay]
MLDAKKLLPFVLAVAACLPGLLLRFFQVELTPPLMAAITGGSILGASFLLTWACDVAQEDIPQTLALAVVALIAVLPEYAVDMYFTWQAGQYPESDYAHYAIANMTGANRLLIGVAWAAIVAIFWMRTRKSVQLEEERRTELFFLGLATLYAFTIPLKGSLAWYDGLVFIGMYVWYIYLASRRPCAECEIEGPAELLARLPKASRRLATVITFLYAALVILACAEPFSENLVATGKVFGVNEFLLVQWLAPIASESPEFIVSILFVLRGHPGIALGSLLSSKLNQWTLLVGMIPGVYGVSSGSFATPIPMGAIQMHEILLTAAQSLLAVVLLVGLKLSIRGASVLFLLFIGQFLAPFWSEGLAAMGVLIDPDAIHMGFSMAYIGLAMMLMILRLAEIRALWRGVRVTQS